jgi:hypothetical protein
MKAEMKKEKLGRRRRIIGGRDEGEGKENEK